MITLRLLPAVLLAVSITAAAQPADTRYPAKPIRMVIPYAAVSMNKDWMPSAPRRKNSRAR